MKATTTIVRADSITLKTERSQKYFNTVVLFFYDLILYGVVSKYAWGCSIERLDLHYTNYIRSNHLEVGVGTGFLLNRAVFDSPNPRIALMDLSPACLTKSKNKVSRYAPETYIQDVLKPVQHGTGQFDSIAINYVMHCVPGSFQEKTIAFTHLQPLLTESGVLFGTTILLEGVRKNCLARPALWLLNTLGVFNNRKDNARELKEFLEQHFNLIEFEVIGITAFFAVRRSSQVHASKE